MTSPPSTPLELLRRYRGVLALMAAGAFLRFSDLSDWWLNPDEGIYYSILTRGSSEGFWQEVMTHAHPPLYYVLLWVFGVFTGEFVWLRAFSVLAGVAAIAGVWAVADVLAKGSSRTRDAATEDRTDGPADDEGDDGADDEGDESGADAAGEARGKRLGAGTVFGESAATRGIVAGLLAGFVFAFAPGPVRLSQVIRPYMLQLALLAWALYLLLRYGARPTGRTLAGYLTLLCLAILTHYSSALALGTLTLVAVVDGIDRGFDDPTWRRLAVWHVLPYGLLAALYLFHLRPLAASALASEALQGWLSYFMINRVADVWWSFLGFQHHLAGMWLRGPMALILLAAIGLAALRREYRVLAVGGGGLLVAMVGAALGLYPLGATRHSAWLLVFTVPVIGWLGALLLDIRSAPRRRLALAAVVTVLVFGGPVGTTLGTHLSRWAPTERVLRDIYLRAMLPELDPSGEPELIVMSDQTFYLLLPFYRAQREAATFASDSSSFHFPYGDRRILVRRTWDFETLRSGPPEADLEAFLRTASSTFPELGIGGEDELLLLLGGWGLPLVEQIREAEDQARLVRSSRTVPGLHAFVLDVGWIVGAEPTP